MLKTSIVGPKDENLEQGGQRIQVKNWDEKEPVQKNRQEKKGQKRIKDQKPA